MSAFDRIASLVRRHRPAAVANEVDHGLERHHLRRERGAGDAALPDEAVALPAAVLDVQLLALLGGRRHRRQTEHEAGGNRREPDLTTNNTH